MRVCERSLHTHHTTAQYHQMPNKAHVNHAHNFVWISRMNNFDNETYCRRTTNKQANKQMNKKQKKPLYPTRRRSDENITRRKFEKWAKWLWVDVMTFINYIFCFIYFQFCRLRRHSHGFRYVHFSRYRLFRQQFSATLPKLKSGAAGKQQQQKKWLQTVINHSVVFV